MKGGDAAVREIPVYPDYNDPGKPADTKAIQQRHPQPQMPQPTMRLELYEPKKKPPPQQPPFQYLPTMTQQPPFPQMFGQMATYTQPNVLNQIYIGDPDPTAQHRRINQVYEDLLPLKDIPTSQNTISERIALHNIIRSILLNNKDGTKINFRKGTNNLFERLKTTEFNPYHYGGIKDNPYSTIPRNMLLYRSCYPIKTVPTGIGCAKDSTGLNIRIYRLTRGEMMINKNPDAKFSDSDVWREIMFYEYIRENIIKKKVCPNFVTMFGYSLCDDSEIDFKQIDEIKNKIEFSPPNNHIMITTPVGTPPVILAQPIQRRFLSAVPIAPIITVPDQNMYCNDILTALTESPTHNFLQWASKKYSVMGKTHQMTHIGYYNENIWMSVLFQLMAALYTLQKHQIHINNMTLADNVYIKDLTGLSTTTNYWKYIIDGVSYYVPNYGYLVLIDSKFKEPVGSGSSIGKVAALEHRIISGKGIFDDSVSLSTININDRIFDSFLNIFNTNNFDHVFEQNGGVHPPAEVLSFIDSIHSYAVKEKSSPTGRKDINKFIYTFMRKFMHNRIGTYLTRQEQEFIAKLDKSFSYGDLIVYEEKPDTFKCVMYGGAGRQPGTAHILTRDSSRVGGVVSNQMVSTDVPIGNVHAYSHIQPLKQEYKMNEAKLDESDLLETYVL